MKDHTGSTPVVGTDCKEESMSRTIKKMIILTLITLIVLAMFHVYNIAKFTPTRKEPLTDCLDRVWDADWCLRHN